MEALASAAAWVSDLLRGPLAYSIAAITIAMLGFAMLAGRVPYRNAIRTFVGCSIIFGGLSIANGIFDYITQVHTFADRRMSLGSDTPGIPSAIDTSPPYIPTTPRTKATDPYSGATISPNVAGLEPDT